MAGEVPSDRSVFGDEIGLKLETMKSQLQMPGDGAEIEIEPGDDMVFEFRCRMVQMANDSVYMMTVVIDRTEERRRERLLRVLLREVSHRSKNLLAIIQSIAFQTARYSGSLDMFLGKFRGRLHALSQSQDLITDSSWRGAYFRDLLSQQVEKYVPENSGLIHVSGEDVLLSPNASLHIGLALHELVVNAVSHGDFLRHLAVINVYCGRITTERGEEIKVTWDEPIAHFDGPDDRSGKGQFGSTVLERVVPASVNGTVDHSFEPNRVYYQLIFPVESDE
ncbi:MAG: sensor histidine kinase [Allorhizobium sp.]